MEVVGSVSGVVNRYQKWFAWPDASLVPSSSTCVLRHPCLHFLQRSHCLCVLSSCGADGFRVSLVPRICKQAMQKPVDGKELPLFVGSVGKP